MHNLNERKTQQNNYITVKQNLLDGSCKLVFVNGVSMIGEDECPGYRGDVQARHVGCEDNC